MPLYALGLVLISALLHASWNVATKGSSSPTAFMLTMEGVAVVLYLPVLALGFVPAEIPREVWFCIGASAVTHSLYAYWLTRGYAHGDLSLVYPIARSTPAVLPLLAVPLLGETVSWLGGLGIGLVVVGMWAIQTEGRLRAKEFLSTGAIFAYLTLLTTVVYSLVDKHAVQLLDAATWTGRAPRVLVYIALFELMFVPLFFVLAMRSISVAEVLKTARSEGKLAIAGAAIGMLSYALALEALRSAPVSYVVAVRQSSVLFAAVLGAIWLRERSGWVRMLGIAATIGGVAVISFYA